MFYLMTHSTHFIYGYMESDFGVRQRTRVLEDPRWLLGGGGLETVKERKKEKVFLTTHSTHFIYGYMASDIW